MDNRIERPHSSPSSSAQRMKERGALCSFGPWVGALAAVGVTGADLQRPSGPAHGGSCSQAGLGWEGMWALGDVPSQHSRTEEASPPQSPTLRVSVLL